MHNQMTDLFVNKLPKYQCGFRKGSSLKDTALSFSDNQETSENS